MTLPGPHDCRYCGANLHPVRAHKCDAGPRAAAVIDALWERIDTCGPWSVSPEDIERAKAASINIAPLAAEALRSHYTKLDAAVQDLVDAGVSLDQIVIEQHRDGSHVVRLRRPEDDVRVSSE